MKQSSKYRQSKKNQKNLKKFLSVDIIRQYISYQYGILSVADENSLSYTYVNKHPELSLIYVLIILSPIKENSGPLQSFLILSTVIFHCISKQIVL